MGGKGGYAYPLLVALLGHKQSRQQVEVAAFSGEKRVKIDFYRIA